MSSFSRLDQLLDLVDKMSDSIEDFMRLGILHVGWRCHNLVLYIDAYLVDLLLLKAVAETFGSVNGACVGESAVRATEGDLDAAVFVSESLSCDDGSNASQTNHSLAVVEVFQNFLDIGLNLHIGAFESEITQILCSAKASWNEKCIVVRSLQLIQTFDITTCNSS